MRARVLRPLLLLSTVLVLALGGAAAPAAAQSTPAPFTLPTAAVPTPAPTTTPLTFATSVPTPTAVAPASTPTDVSLPPLPTITFPTPASTSQPVPTVAVTPFATRTPPLVPLQANVTPTGQPTIAQIPPSGGQLALADGSLTVQALPDPSRPALTLVYQGVDARTLPPAQNGISLGFAAYQLSAVNNDTRELIPSVNVPIDLVVNPGQSDLALALGQYQRLYVGMWNGSSWVAVPCGPGAARGTIVCSTTHLGLFVPLVVLPTNPATVQLDYSVPGGHFYTQGNGFGGGGGLGYAVFDDADVPMWSEYQRQGGVPRLGYPVTNRFLYQGAVTQAFQKGALQWIPDAGEATLLNIMDELHAHGSDGWLDSARQIPPPPPGGAPSDPGILAPFPDILATYGADPDLYGLPVSIKDYGALGSARFQRSSLQVWEQDQPFAAAGTVIPGASGDLAKAAGLWPVDAGTPDGPPPS
jgi:hypothetical protein